MFLLKNFCEKRKYVGSKTRNCVMKCFWWWGYVQRNKVVIVFQNRKSWVCHKNCYNLSKTNNFCSNFRNIFAAQLCKYLKIKKTFCETKFFPGTRFPSSTTISSSVGGGGLTACNPHLALLPVQWVELEVHGAGQGQGDPGVKQQLRIIDNIWQSRHLRISSWIQNFLDPTFAGSRHFLV